MHCYEDGVLPGSDKYVFAVDQTQRDLHYFIASCGHYACTFGYKIRRPFYAHLLIAYINSGTLCLSFQEHTLTARSGDLLLIDPQVPHHYYSRASLDFLWFHIDGCNAHALCADINEKCGYVFTHPNRDSIRRHMLEIIYACRNNQPMESAIVSSRVHCILCLCYPPQSEPQQLSRDTHGIAIVIEYLKTHFSETVTVDDMSRIASLSRFHFSRIFKQYTGQAPYQYLLALRFDYAKHLLRTTALPVGEVASRAGFKNEMGFISAFSNKIGMPPGKYRHFPL